MITDHLQYLIMRHDCVVLPGIGAFLARYESARLDGLFILPPRRVIGFNADLTHDDGLLAGSIARSTGCGYEAASAEVSRCVESILRRIDAGQNVTISRIGTLSRGESGAMTFNPAPDEVSAANAMYAALPKVSVPSGASESPNVSRVLDIDMSARGNKVPFALRALKYAAAAAIVVGIAITASTPIVVNRTADFASISAPAVTPAQTRFVPSSDDGRQLFLVRPDSASSMAVLAPPVENIADYYLIVASFVTEREASRFIAERGDSRLRIVKSERRCRVYANAGSSFSEAASLVKDSSFSDRYPDAWVYKRR